MAGRVAPTCLCTEAPGGRLGEGELRAQVSLPLRPKAGLWLSLLCGFGVALLCGAFTCRVLSRARRDGTRSSQGSWEVGGILSQEIVLQELNDLFSVMSVKGGDLTSPGL